MSQDALRFEIAVPAGDAAAQQAEDLRAYAERAGLTAHQLPVEDVITLGGLKLVSNDMWGNSAYGAYAFGMLQSLQASVARHGRVIVDRDHQAQLLLPTFDIFRDTAYLGDVTQLSDQAIDDAARATLRAIPAPFELRLANSGLPPELVARRVVAGPPTAQRLARYLLAGSFVDSRLPGLHGKAAAVLLHAASLPTGDLQTHEWTGPFIGIPQLFTMLAQNNFPPSAIVRLKNKITDMIYAQDRTGGPNKDGELIIEVSTPSLRIAPDGIPGDRIALQSLVNIANGYTRSSELAGFLRQLARQSAQPA